MKAIRGIVKAKGSIVNINIPKGIEE